MCSIFSWVRRSGSLPISSLTASLNLCLQPRYFHWHARKHAPIETASAPVHASTVAKAGALQEKGRVPVSQDDTSRIESLHLPQASLEETPLTFVAHERKGALVAGCGIC